jgi:hypothetical protein
MKHLRYYDLPTKLTGNEPRSSGLLSISHLSSYGSKSVTEAANKHKSPLLNGLQNKVYIDTFLFLNKD